MCFEHFEYCTLAFDASHNDSSSIIHNFMGNTKSEYRVQKTHMLSAASPPHKELAQSMHKGQIANLPKPAQTFPYTCSSMKHY